MVWNTPNDNESDIDPWGKKKKNDKNFENHTDEKKIIKKNHSTDMKDFLYKIGDTITNKHNSSKLSKNSINPIFIIIFISFFIWFFHGFYTIKENERGVITTFGKFSKIVTPGLHWRPVFINNIKVVNINIMRELTTTGLMLTSDENIVRVSMNIQYKINNPVHYLFSLSHPDDSLHQSTDSIVRNIIGNIDINHIFTKEHKWIRDEIRKGIENIIKPYNMGIRILDVNVRMISIPEKVKSSFNHAIIASENYNQHIREAQIYCRKMIFQTNVKAEKIIQKAKIYASRIIIAAEGEVEQFLTILPAYKLSKKITLQRLYLESMEKILGNTRKILINGKNNIFLSINNSLDNMPLIFNPIKYYIKPHKHNINLTQKNKNNLSLFFPNEIFEQYHVNSIHNYIKNSEKK
ncbi:FtsH protease activity modulator HflK [Buchnera aphidicola]|uniref:FtsH protease activity modulator HflK n=1 Tax=Buchnera aphidicola TaxID=9 RepID=UPI003BEF15A5